MADAQREEISIGDEVANLILCRLTEGAAPYVVGQSIGETLAELEQSSTIIAAVVGVIRARLNAPAGDAEGGT